MRKTSLKSSLLLAFTLFAFLVNMFGQQAANLPEGFVYPDGRKFMISDGNGGGSPYYFSGTNNYYLMYKPMEMVEDVLNDMVSLGQKAVRMWIFMDGKSHDGYVLQSEPGVYDEYSMKHIDEIMVALSQRGLKAVPVFVNYWRDFGGMNQYATWAGASANDFYSNATCKQIYRDYMQMWANRVNSITGVAYKDDPTILSWQLTNEARATSSNLEDMMTWVEEMSDYLRTQDPNHMISLGDEGFFNYAYADIETINAGLDGYEITSDWTYCSGNGDWERVIQMPNISYGTVHNYATDNWGYTLEWGEAWTKYHIEIANKYNVPCVMEEYDKAYSGLWDETKDQERADVLSSYQSLIRDLHMAGDMSWMLVGRNYTDPVEGGYTMDNTASVDQIWLYRVKWPGDGHQYSRYDPYTGPVIKEHCRLMNEKSGNNGPVAPIANAGKDQTVIDSDQNGKESVTLDASSCFDPDGTIDSYIWYENNSQIATGISPTLALDTGTHIITLVITDNDGEQGTDAVKISLLEGGARVLEAESATLSGNTTIVSDASASNGQFVQMGAATTTITFTVDNVPASLTYPVSIFHRSYNADAGNGSKINFVSTSAGGTSEYTFAASSTWTEEVFNLALVEGSNTISIDASWGYMEFDYISIEGIGADGGAPTNKIPIASSNGNQSIIDTDGNGFETVTLDGSASTDTDGTIDQYLWIEDGVQIATGVTASVDLSLGSHNIQLKVIDNEGASDNDDFIVTISSGGTSAFDIGDGVNLQPSYYNSGDVDISWDLMKQYPNIKSVRLEIEPDEGVDINTAKRWIQEANANGYEVIATCHNYQYNGSDDVNALLNSANWWKNNYATLAQGGQFTVNLMNEWGSHEQTPASYASAYNQAISIVREVYSGPIIIDIAGWAQETQCAYEASSLISDNNIVYSVHIYNSAYVQYGSNSWMTTADLDVLASTGRPVIVGEFGGNRTGGADWSALVDHAKSKGWPVIGWAWNGDGEGMNMTQPMWPSTPTSVTDYFNTVYTKLDDEIVCNPTTITSYIQVNGGAWEETNTVTVNVGDEVVFGPHPNTGGSWLWSGVNGLTSTERELVLTNVQTSDEGSYNVTYTNDCGTPSYATINLTVTGDIPDNIALGKPATTSSTDGYAGGAAEAVDGDMNTRWASAWNNNEWLMVDLQDNYNIDNVVIYWEAAYSSAYQIQLSIDGSSWTDIYSTSNGDGGTDNLAVSGTGRYIRLNCSGRATEWGNSVWEFEVYGTPAGTTPYLNVSSSSMAFNAASGSNNVNISSNVSWSASTNESWISLSPTNGENNGTVSISVDENTSTSNRTGTITISGTGVDSQTISISQSGASETNIYEAEYANLYNVSNISDAEASNGQYVYMEGNNGSITWTVDVPASGTYTINVGYNIPYGNKTQYLNVNGSYYGDIEFDGSTNVWQEKAIDVALNAGSNTIALTAYWGYMYFDYLSINTSSLKSSDIGNSSSLKKMLETNELIVYPNPVMDILNIRGLKEGSYYKVIDVSGSVRMIDNKEKVDFSGLANGLYFISVDNEKLVKIIKK